MIKLIYCYH